jgi:cell division protein FtsA
MGSETMVMALAEVSAGRVRVLGVERAPSAGVERGRVTDEARARASVDRLLKTFRMEHGMIIDRLRVALPMTWLKRLAVEKTARFSHPRPVPDARLLELEEQARAAANDNDREIVSILPRSYTVDGRPTRDPREETAGRLDVEYALYLARDRDMAATRAWLAGAGIQQVDFYATVEAESRALIARQGDARDAALVDLGADSTRVLVFQRGLVVHDAELPLGCRSIDEDLNRVFKIESMDKARRLKHEFGVAIRIMRKDRKIIIPETNYSIHLNALLQVEQCRLEELIEGALFQVQQSGCYNKLPGGILLTGGGSRVEGIETLTAKLSGHPARKAVAAGVPAGEWSREPGYLTALGLLACEGKTPAKANWWGRIFK